MPGTGGPMSKRSHARGAILYEFVAVPKAVLQSTEWQALPPSARALAMDLMAQYSGKNNGRLCPAFTVMERCGWTSRTTLIQAKRALLECPFVLVTRKGHAPRTAEWIAFSWWPLHYERSMDIDPARFPYLNFMKLERIDPNQGRGRPPAKSNCVVQKLDQYPAKQAPGRPETGLMEARA
jgi:hypothetical protein